MKQVTVIIVGNGDRANCYCRFALNHPESLKVAAIVDPSERKRREGAEKYGVPSELCFHSVAECMEYHEAHGRIADAVLDCTMDELHYETAMPFLEKGYHMLLEKPIVNNMEQLLEIKRTAEANGCLLMVCHVLRYTPFFMAVKEVILRGDIGEIVHMETSENVGVAHSSNSYIRGKWNSKEKCGSSMLLAKCCHDMDLLCWLNNETFPVRVASFGGRDFLVPGKAPKDAGTRCLVDCPYVDTCQYSAKSIYVMNDKFPWYSWDCIDKKYDEISKEEKIESLRTFNPHGVCAYKTGSDIVDHQALVLHFANGSTATHTMIQGTVVPRRLTRIVGTKGEIEGSLDACKFTVYKYDFDKAWYTAEEVDIRERIAKDDHHAGGDDGIIRDFVSMIRGGKTSVSCTKIQDSIYGHLCVFMADASMEEQEEKDIK